MANFNRSRSSWRVTPSSALLALLLLAALGLSTLPPSTTQMLRSTWREALLPAQRSLSVSADLVAKLWNKLPIISAAAATAQADQKIVELNDEVERLQTALLLANTRLAPASRPDSDDSGASSTPLLVNQVIAARVLGQQAQAFLLTRDLLDVGKSRGATVGSFVLNDLPPTVDQGRDAEIKSGRLVLAGSSVWGKVAEVGPHTCTVRRITDPGYRDLVQLATPRDGRLQFSTRGVLVGAGQRLCKIELVDVTEPVAEGDLVFTTDDGVLDAPLLYGKVARLERKPGDPHWQIWMEPAVKPNAPPAHVAVLKIELNSARIAETKSQESGIRSQ